MTKLYSRDTKGKIREWSIEIENGRYRTIHGVVGGKLQTTEWTQVKEKNIGRANHRDLLEQAKFEAEALIKKQTDQGWKSSIEELNSTSKDFDCMLAQKWEDRKDEVTYPLFSNPKLDGVRLNVTSTKLLSRNKKEFLSVSHLNGLKDYCKKYNMILDGELYNHQFKDDFNSIVSIVKKTKPTQEDLEKSKKFMQYWIYDVYFIDDPDMVFLQRHSKLLSIFKKENIFLSFPCVRILPLQRIESPVQLNDYYEKYLDQGYEGQIIRTDSPYDQKRSKYLLKRKEFQDEEFKILEVGEGNGNRSGMAGYMILKNKDKSTFRSNIKGSQEWLAILLKEKDSLIGKMATVQFFNYTPDGVPRFPYVTSIRDFE